MRPSHAGTLIGLEETQGDASKSLFLDCLQLIERLHRRLLDVIKNRMEIDGRTDLNAVQALLLYNIGGSELTAGELRTRGYYLGSNVTYNLKKLVEMGYINHARSEHDRRSVRISLTPMGIEVCELVDSLYDEQLTELLADGLLSPQEMKALRRSLRNLERFWTDRIHFGS